MTMMKFKSLFRRGHHSHQSQQQKQPHRHQRNNHNQQLQQQQQQVAPPTQASSSGSPHEDMSKRSPEGAATSVTWLSSSSVGRDLVPQSLSVTGKNNTSRNQMKGAPPLAKGSYERMQELERENNGLRKERSHFDVNLRNPSTCDPKRLDEHHAELALLKVK